MVSVKSENLIFHGIAASPGIVIGEARIADRSRVAVVEASIDSAEVPAEIDRFRLALAKAIEELKLLKQQISTSKGSEHLYVIDAHLLILQDSMLTRETVDFIERERINAEAALKRTL